jgi:hypothetical protein
MVDQPNAPLEPPVRNDGGSQIRLIAFSEPPEHGKSKPVLLHVYIVNESPEILEILNDLDSINIPQGLYHGSEKVSTTDLIHIDFGVSGVATFIQVATGECLKITLLLREEQFALLERIKHICTSVKFRDVGDEKGEVTTLLLAARVYKTNQ